MLNEFANSTDTGKSRPVKRLVFANPLSVGIISAKIRIARASENEMAEITRLARSFALDCEDLRPKQFLTAEKNNKVIGFGRLKKYPSFTELATLGVVPEERNKGIGSAIAGELLSGRADEIYVACVIPDFFARLGFQIVKNYPALLKRKVDFCKRYGFNDDEIFVMLYAK